MLERENNSERKSHVKFIKYTGAWPSLCIGELTLEIDGKEYKFGGISGYDSFWVSGGSCGFNNGYIDSRVTKASWIIFEEHLPEHLKIYAEEIDRVFNENVSWGCCGGCL